MYTTLPGMYIIMNLLYFVYIVKLCKSYSICVSSGDVSYVLFVTVFQFYLFYFAFSYSVARCDREKEKESGRTRLVVTC